VSTPAAVDVAVAVLLRPDGTFLLAQRPAKKVYAGYWEFPGGKVEPGETVREALVREIREELGVEITAAYPWITQVFTYPHATVRLHFYRVTRWVGEPATQPHEHEAVVWQALDNLTVMPLLPANTTVMRALRLPEEYAVSDAAGMGEIEFLVRLESRLRKGLRLLQLREKSMDVAALEPLAMKVVALARTYGARVLINGDVDLARRIGAHGVHFSASQLMGLPLRPELAWCAASCHDAAELRRAEELGLDFVALGPVLDTPSHPGAKTLGWDGFASLARGAALPVYAIGGMRPDLLEKARTLGAHGVAMIRGSWQQ
jgi:8-oxo-dGTP diphosphatase